MRLLQLKIRGLGDLPETGWLEAGRRFTVITSSNRRSCGLLMGAVEALNPATPCRETESFRELPLETTTGNGYKKIIDPGKRTVIFGIYDSPSALVHELGHITAPLYETDRIEVGRRLDYSRWINFVELASSTRWSEIAEEIQRLRDASQQCGNDEPEITSLTNSLSATDRIKGEYATRISNWLRDIKRHLPAEDISDTLEKIERWDRFQSARRVVENCLPLMVAASPLAPSHGEFEQSVPETDRSERMAPIYLLDFFEEKSSGVDEILRKLASESSANQIIAFVNASYSPRALPEEAAFHRIEVTV